MKSFCLILCFMVAPLWAQAGLALSVKDIRGISLGYSYRPIFLFGTNTGTTMYPTHVLTVNLDGKIKSAASSSSYYYDNNDDEPGFFGGLGLVVGLSAAQEVGTINSKDCYYSNYYRVTALNQGAGDMVLIGANVRGIFLLPFSAQVSIVDSYFDFQFEAGYMGFNYDAVAGGFNNYVTKKVSEGGTYCGLNLGVKVFIVEVYGGLGGLFGLYKKGVDLKVEDEKIANPPDETNIGVRSCISTFLSLARSDIIKI